MADKLILPQNTRLMGVFLGFIGGSLDVFCHIQYHSLVATQTGNILLLISDWHDSNVINTMLRFCSIIFFSLGFLFALHHIIVRWQIIPSIVLLPDAKINCGSEPKMELSASALLYGVIRSDDIGILLSGVYFLMRSIPLPLVPIR